MRGFLNHYTRRVSVLSRFHGQRIYPCHSENLFDLTYRWAKDWINLGKPETKGHVYLISSSQDDELSFEHVMGCVFTSAYLKNIKHPQTWRSLMQKLTQTQTPELSTGQRENIDDTFDI